MRRPPLLIQSSRIEVFVVAAAVLDHRDRLPDAALNLEKAQHDNGIGNVADAQRPLQRADQPDLRAHQQRQHAALV